MTKTFLDACVIESAFKEKRKYHEEAFAVMWDPKREFVSSTLLELELTSAQAFPEHQEEAEFYKRYMRLARHKHTDVQTLSTEAFSTVRATGIDAMDALHVTAAIIMGADEFITVEKQGRPLYSEKRIPVIFLGDLAATP